MLIYIYVYIQGEWFLKAITFSGLIQLASSLSASLQESLVKEICNNNHYNCNDLKYSKAWSP